jgi:hypothetical protein
MSSKNGWFPLGMLNLTVSFVHPCKPRCFQLMSCLSRFALGMCYSNLSSPILHWCLVKQGKFKVGVAAADGLGHSLLKIIVFVFIKRSSLAMSAGAKPMTFRPIWMSCIHKCIILLVLRFLCSDQRARNRRNESIAAGLDVVKQAAICNSR